MLAKYAVKGIHDNHLSIDDYYSNIHKTSHTEILRWMYMYSNRYMYLLVCHPIVVLFGVTSKRFALFSQF